MRCKRCGLEFGEDLPVPGDAGWWARPIPKPLWLMAACVAGLVLWLADKGVGWVGLSGAAVGLVLVFAGLARLDDSRRAASGGQSICPVCAMRPLESVVTVSSPTASVWVAVSAYVCLGLCFLAMSFQFVFSLVFGLVGIALLICGLSDGITALRQARNARDGAKADAAVGAIGLNGFGCLAVALLLVILPVGPRYPRESAKKTKSLNNVKQLAIATLTYSEDYGGALPGWVRNPDGRYAHNTWDEQINSQVKAKDAFNNGDAGIRSYSQTGTHDRVLTYGLNGLLITSPKAQFDGNADFASASVKGPPKPRRLRDLADPANTILFAELSTNAPMPGVYGRRPDPKPHTWKAGETTPAWQAALTGWIDISPRAFIEVDHAPGTNPYQDPYGKNGDSGIARDLYGGGGVYAFADGHCKFMKIGTSVGLGTTVDGKDITEQNCWSQSNTNNRWVPR